jgi:curved DNA-binding protein CbpA
MPDHGQIDEARKILRLGESATIPEIKEAYRRLSLKYHPDKCAENDKKKCEELFKKINNANKVLIEHCLSYRFQFKEIDHEASLEESRAKDHMKRFYETWWSDLNND